MAESPASDAAEDSGATTSEQASPEAPPPVVDDGHAAMNDLLALRLEVEHAQFEAADARARALLEGPLSARDRNDTLELLAIAQIAARQEAAAQATLAELFARDPEHPERIRDPGPSVEAFFARVRAQDHRSLGAGLQVAARREDARVLVSIELTSHWDAVDSVHVVSLAPRSELSLVEPTHVVGALGTRDRLTLALPALTANTDELAIYVEARTPSGHVLGGSGSPTAPLRIALPAEPRAQEIQPTPLRRTWWLWTSVAIVAAGIAITAAVAAR